MVQMVGAGGLLGGFGSCLAGAFLGFGGVGVGFLAGLAGSFLRLGLFFGLGFAQAMLLVEMFLVEAVGGHFLVEGLDFAGLVADGRQQGVEFLVLVGGESRMGGTVGEVLGRHIEEVVGGLEASPVFFQLSVVAELNALGDGVELVERFLLDFVSEPCRGIAGFIGP